jgi:MFS family permease
LVALFAPIELKNTYLATLRVIGLAIAMMVQPMAGLLSDRSTHRLGRRRPYILGGTLFNVLFLFVMGASTLFVDSELNAFFVPLLGVTTAYVVLVVGSAFQQAAVNVSHGALQGLIPDLVPEEQRGRASGVKGVMELLPVFLVVFMGPLVDAGKIWLTVGIVAAVFLFTMLLTVLGVHETPLKEKPSGSVREPMLRLVALTAIFVGVTQFAVWVVRTSGFQLAQRGAEAGVQIAVIALVGLLGMAGSIFVGVYFGAWVGIGKEARQQSSFIWWVINRLLFLAALNSIQGFAQYFLADVLHIPNAATVTTQLLAVVGVFLVITVIVGGHLADRVGRRRLVAISGLITAGGTFLLLFATNIPLVLVSGCIIGTGAGIFWASNWALGTDLVPSKEAGRYLGISNLAGAGAGIVGAGIGGPMADFFNRLRPGLGYLVIFAIYGSLFLLSVLALTQVKRTTTA